MFIEHERPVGRISPKPVFEIGYPTLSALLDIRFVVAFGCEQGDLRSVHSNETGDDGNFEASTDPRGPRGTMNALAERLNFNRVGSFAHNLRGSDNDLPLAQSAHDVPHDGGGRCVSRQNIFRPELLHVLEHKPATRGRARLTNEQSGGAKVVQSGAAEDSANAVRNKNDQAAVAAPESLIFDSQTWVDDSA